MQSSADRQSRGPFREALLFGLCLLFGVLVLPFLIFFVGGAVFGEYAGGGLAGFYRSLLSALGNANGVTWFLVLSPYLTLQGLRGSVWVFRRL